MTTYRYSLALALPPEEVFVFFADLERWFRLNPQWDVESFGKYEFRAGSCFSVTVTYDRNEQQVCYEGCIAELIPGERLTIVLQGDLSRSFGILVQQNPSGTNLQYQEETEAALSGEEKTELNLWLRSVGNYLLVTSRRTVRSHMWRWFVDRIWLKMSPFGRRITVMVLLGEAFSFGLFILFLIWHFYFR